MKLSSNKNSSIILLVVLMAALLFAIYYYVVLPKKDNVETLEGSVNSLQSEITSLQGQLDLTGEQTSTDPSNVFAIRQKLPQSRELDQLILNLEEIQYVTDSRITSIGFNSYDELVSESTIVPTPEEEAAAEEPTEGTTEAETSPESEEGTTDEAATGEEVVETPVSQIAAEALPPELKLITFNLEIEAPAHQNIQQFIKEIEKLERIMHIDTISYTLPGEEGEITEDVAETLTASVQVTSFYYEGES